MLDQVTKRYTSTSEHQRGFTNQPGTHINTSLIAACLKKAKQKKMDASIVFLDIVKAFNMIGYDHVENTIQTTSLPSKMKDLILHLQVRNFTRIHANGNKSEKLHFRKGLLQGAPLSPTIFNLCIDYVLQELTEVEVANEFGFRLVQDLSPLSAAGFADDTAVIAKGMFAASQLSQMAIQLFEECGLDISPGKSMVINITKGKLNETDLQVNEETVIPALKTDEKIKYLGVNFQDQLFFDESSTIHGLTKDLQLLTTTALLKPEQKLQIMNQYLWPKVVFPFQTAPLGKIPQTFLENMDKATRSATKEILGIPNDTPDAMIYSPTIYKGLGLVRAKWEAPIQIHSISNTLMQSNNKYLNDCRDFKKEMTACMEKLGLTEDEFGRANNAQHQTTVGAAGGPNSTPDGEEEAETPEKTSRKMRKLLREKEFQKWCDLPTKGQGVSLFKQQPVFNKWITTKNGLSASEWISNIKMTANVAAVRAVPGRSLTTSLCRHCKEYESLGHVLGSCRRGELLRNSRHHQIRTMIANGFRKKGLDVYEEVHCISGMDSTRRIDMIVLSADKKSGLVIDPTIRIEKAEDQPEETDREKRNIYEPCAPYLCEKYGIQNVEVVGLFIGSRGTISTFLYNFVKKHKLGKELVKNIVTSVLKSSAHILHNHLFGN